MPGRERERESKQAARERERDRERKPFNGEVLVYESRQSQPCHGHSETIASGGQHQVEHQQRARPHTGVRRRSLPLDCAGEDNQSPKQE